MQCIFLGAPSLNLGLLIFTLFRIRILPADPTLMILKESDTVGCSTS